MGSFKLINGSEQFSRGNSGNYKKNNSIVLDNLDASELMNPNLMDAESFIQQNFMIGKTSENLQNKEDINRHAKEFKRIKRRKRKQSVESVKIGNRNLQRKSRRSAG